MSDTPRINVQATQENERLKLAMAKKDEALREMLFTPTNPSRWTSFGRSALSTDGTAELATVRKMMEAFRVTAIRCFNIGKLHGHEDTVEARFTLVMPQDLATYDEELVDEMLTDGSLPEAKEVLTEARKVFGKEKN